MLGRGDTIADVYTIAYVRYYTRCVTPYRTYTVRRHMRTYGVLRQSNRLIVVVIVVRPSVRPLRPFQLLHHY